MKTIVLTGGGTAGHVLPHIALLPYIEQNFDKIYYIGSGEPEHGIIANYPKITYFSITSVKLRRSLDLRNLTIPFKLGKGISQTKKLLKQLKPDVVFSKGGFVAYPVVKAAASLDIPVISHESDMTMGLANKLSAKHCKIICTTFKTTAEALGRYKDKAIYTGSPIREQIYKGYSLKVEKRHRLTGTKKLLVLGGSLGAAKINGVVRTSLQDLAKNYSIIHITGKGKADETVKHSNYFQLEFARDIEHYFAWADVVISRAGSNALCELIALKKPTLFIPLSTGRGDQLENAKYVKGLNCAEILLEDELTPCTLVLAVEKLYKTRENYVKNMPANIDGTQKIAKIIIDGKGCE